MENIEVRINTVKTVLKPCKANACPKEIDVTMPSEEHRSDGIQSPNSPKGTIMSIFHPYFQQLSTEGFDGEEDVLWEDELTVKGNLVEVFL